MPRKQANRAGKGPWWTSSPRASLRIFFKNIALSFTILCLFLLKPANSADLVGIRLTPRKDFSRLEVEFDTPIEFSLNKDSEDNLLSLLIWPIQSVKNMDPLVVFPLDKFFKHVEYERIGSTLQLRIFLKSSDIIVQTERLDWPVRLILDVRSSKHIPAATPNRLPSRSINTKSTNVYAPGGVEASKQPNQDPTQPRQNLPGAKAKESNGSASDTTISDLNDVREDSVISEHDGPVKNDIAISDSVNQDGKWTTRVIAADSLYTGPEIFKFDFLSKQSPSSQEPDQRETETAATSKSRQTFWKLLAAFILLDLLIGGIYFMVKRKKPAPKALSPAKEKVAVVDENEVFMNLLHNTLKRKAATEINSESIDQPSQELEVAKTAIKIDGMIEALSSAMGSVNTAEIDLKVDPFVRELNKLSVGSGLTVDELIGKDGQEFARNLKKLQNK